MTPINHHQNTCIASIVHILFEMYSLVFSYVRIECAIHEKYNVSEVILYRSVVPILAKLG